MKLEVLEERLIFEIIMVGGRLGLPYVFELKI